MEVDLRTDLLGLATSADVRLDELGDFARTMHAFLTEQATRVAEEPHTRPHYDLYQFERPFPEILHSSLIISIVMLLEGQLRDYSRSVQRAFSLHLGLRDVNGSLLERFRKYITGVARIQLSFEESEWLDLLAIVELRNCLVHSQGYLPEFSARENVKALGRRHSEVTVEDDFVVVSSDTSDFVFRKIREFLNRIYEDLDRCS